MAAATKINRIVQAHRQKVTTFPKLHGHVVPIRSRLVKCILRRAERCVLGRHHCPCERSKPWLNTFHGLFRRTFGFSLDPLQLLHALAFQVAFPCFRVNRLSGEAVLDSQSFGNQLLKERIIQQLRINRRGSLGFHDLQNTCNPPCPQSLLLRAHREFRG